MIVNRSKTAEKTQTVNGIHTKNKGEIQKQEKKSENVSFFRPKVCDFRAKRRHEFSEKAHNAFPSKTAQTSISRN